MDSSIMIRYGDQETVKKGYNPRKNRRKSCHPIIKFINDVRMVIKFCFRSGYRSKSNNFMNFSAKTLSIF